MLAATVTSICLFFATDGTSGTFMVYIVSVVNSALLVCGFVAVLAAFAFAAVKLTCTVKNAPRPSAINLAILKSVRLLTGFALAGTCAAGLQLLTACAFRSDRGRLVAEILKLAGSVLEVVWMHGVLYVYYGTWAGFDRVLGSRSLTCPPPLQTLLTPRPIDPGSCVRLRFRATFRRPRLSRLAHLVQRCGSPVSSLALRC